MPASTTGAKYLGQKYLKERKICFGSEIPAHGCRLCCLEPVTRWDITVEHVEPVTKQDITVEHVCRACDEAEHYSRTCMSSL